ncbi:nuclear protein MDM1 [Ctenodactylus gundi]
MHGDEEKALYSGDDGRLQIGPPGLSEYQRNFLWKKSYLSESCNSTVGRKYPWAGLRSDQLGITKEPSFISKRRVPYHDSQISKSLEWKGATSENDVAVSPQREAPATPKAQETEPKEVINQERVLPVKDSRVPKRTRSHSADSRAEGATDTMEKKEDVVTNHAPVADSVELECSMKRLSENVDNGVDRLLRKKAGLTIVPSHNSLRNSEYQRQFVWKTSKETAPVFAANQVFHNKNKFVPQFKGNSFIHETEYKRNFKGLSPIKEPKLMKDLKENGNLEPVTPEKKCNKTDDPLKLEAEMASEDSNQPKKKFTPWRHQKLGKVNSEYRAKFLSPAQYLYKAGAWTRVKENMPNQGSLNAMWYAEVKELREKAEFYRKRVQGTHFSRDHLNQILSDKNCCWDVSSTTSSEGTISSNIIALDLAGDPTSHKILQKCSSEKTEEKRDIVEEEAQKDTTEQLGLSEAATLPVRRRLAWDAEDTCEDTQKQPKEEDQEEPERGQNEKVYAGELEKLDVHEKPEAAKTREGSDSSSVSSGSGGRLPTPKLRELGGIQRTHHDLTTPAVGGAVLVSPTKVKPSATEQRRKMSSQDGLETSKNDSTKKESCAISVLTSPAAGIKTVDPLPLREDSEGNVPRFAEATLPVSKIPEHPTHTHGQSSCPPYATSFWHPSRRIQGALRNPEFQHNVGKSRMNNFQISQHEAFNDKDEDRLSEISARSAASSLRALQTLARAQKRKENFWGKT